MADIAERPSHNHRSGADNRYTAESILTELRRGHTDEAMRELNRDHWKSPQNFAKVFGEVNHGIDRTNQTKHSNLPHLELVHPDGKVDGDANSKFTGYKLGDTKYSTKSVRSKETLGAATTTTPPADAPGETKHKAPAGVVSTDRTANGTTTGGDNAENFEAVTTGGTGPAKKKGGSQTRNDGAPRTGGDNAENFEAVTNGSTTAKPPKKDAHQGPANPSTTTDSTTPPVDNKATPKTDTTKKKEAAPEAPPPTTTLPPSKFTSPAVKEMSEEEFKTYCDAVGKIDPKYASLVGPRAGFVDSHGNAHEAGSDGSRLDRFNGNGPKDMDIGELRSVERTGKGDIISTNVSGDVKTKNTDGSYKIQFANGDFTEHKNSTTGYFRHKTADGVVQENNWRKGFGHRSENWTKTTWPDGSSEFLDMDGKKIVTTSNREMSQRSASASALYLRSITDNLERV